METSDYKDWLVNGECRDEAGDPYNEYVAWLRAGRPAKPGRCVEKGPTVKGVFLGYCTRMAHNDHEMHSNSNWRWTSGFDPKPQPAPAPSRAILERSDGTTIDLLSEEVASYDFQQDVEQIMDEAAKLLIRKHHDYGPKNISGAPGGALNGIRVRLYDKLARLNNLVDSDKEPNFESIEDTLVDALNYCAIALLVVRGKWPE